MAEGLAWRAYCGAPSVPGGAAWNWDPQLGTALVAALALARARSAERRALLAGWAVPALALVSPLCSLSVALSSAWVGQHLVILLAAAPRRAEHRHAAQSLAAPA